MCFGCISEGPRRMLWWFPEGTITNACPSKTPASLAEHLTHFRAAQTSSHKSQPSTEVSELSILIESG